MFESELQRIKAEHSKDICEVKFRIEQAIKDQNDKLDAILGHFGLKIEKNIPESTKYRIAQKGGY